MVSEPFQMSSLVEKLKEGLQGEWKGIFATVC